MKSNELIKLFNVENEEEYECKPNTEFVPRRGKFRLWGDAHLKDDNNETICHLRVLDFKDGAELPEILFPEVIKPKAKVKKVQDDLL